MSYIQARDISQYQGAWKDTGEPIVMIKMSGGDGGTVYPNGLYFDSHAADNYAKARAAGKAVGGYHFAGSGNPVTEADFFVRAMSPLAQYDVMALDWEVEHANPVEWCAQFMNEVHAKTGVWPLLYINASTCNAYDWSVVLKTCGLWIADYAVLPTENVPIKYPYVMHQYSDTPYDRDAWFGTLAQFNAYGYHTPITPPQTTTTTVPPRPTTTSTSTTTATTTSSSTTTTESTSTSTTTTTLPPPKLSWWQRLFLWWRRHNT